MAPEPPPSGGRRLAVLAGTMVLVVAALVALATWASTRG